MLERGHSTLPSPLILINPRSLRGRKGHLSFVVRNSSHEMTSGGLVFFYRFTRNVGIYHKFN